MNKQYSIDDILNLDALTQAIIQSDDFVEAVAELKEDQIKGLVEDAVNDYDFSDAIRNEVTDYGDDITDLGERIENLENGLGDLNTEVNSKEEAFNTLIKGLQKQNAILFGAIGELERTVEYLKKIDDASLSAILAKTFKKLMNFIHGY